MAYKILEHFSFDVPESSCCVKRTSGDNVLLWEMTKAKTKNCISVSWEGRNEISSIRVPYFTGSIIAGSSKILSVFAECAVGEWLLMSLELKIFLEGSLFFLIGSTNFYLNNSLLATAWFNWIACLLSTSGFWGTKADSTYYSTLILLCSRNTLEGCWQERRCWVHCWLFYLFSCIVCWVLADSIWFLSFLDSF